MSADALPVFALDAAAIRLVERVRSVAALSERTGLNHWLRVVLDECGLTYVDDPSPGALARYRDDVASALAAGEPGEDVAEPDILLAAQTIARVHGRDRVTQPDIARAVFVLAGHRVSGPASVLGPENLWNVIRAATTEVEPATTATTLEQVGEDLTAAARRGELRPLVGREEELQTLIEVLLRSTKRNPVLIGPPGVGKTAIAEGLAARIAEGSVPEFLKRSRVISLHPGTLLVGVENTSALQQRVKKLVEEASTGDVILFIDEVHALVGMGGDEGRGDLATLLKPALARGQIACIAATTDSEYRRFIEADGALERRFQPVRINEPGRDVVLQVLRERADDLASSRGVRVAEKELVWFYEFAERFLRSRSFPDKALDLLEQAVARAAADGAGEVTATMAREVAERLIGMPVSIPERVEALRVELARRGILGVAEIESIIENVHVRMRGFGVNPLRPNAVVLLLDEAAAAVDELCEALAVSLYGAEDRIVSVELTRLGEAGSVALLVGAPPSYIGYKDPVPLHELLQTPWSVVRLSNIQAAHPSVRAILESALGEGYFTDGSGRRIHLSDCVVVVTASTGEARLPDEKPRALAERTLGHELSSVCDVVVCDLPEGGQPFRHWLERDLLTGLGARLDGRGLAVQWHASVLDWLETMRERYPHPLELQRSIDRELTHALIGLLPEDGERRDVVVRWNGSELTVAATG